jgi:hypothetical protein
VATCECCAGEVLGPLEEHRAVSLETATIYPDAGSVPGLEVGSPLAAGGIDRCSP